MARPTKLTLPLQRAFCRALRQGLTYSSAAELLGVDTGTVGRWLSRGREEEEGPHADFAVACAKARAQATQRLLKIAFARVAEGTDSPLPLLTMIEPRYAPRVRVTLEQEINGLLDKIERAFSSEPAIYERVLAAIAEEAPPSAEFINAPARLLSGEAEG
jgi:transcriptional regulator with XRE-family HTH domain